MFYAPWSAESQYARQPFESVAKLFHKEAHFAAINCWQPGGECKQQYAKVDFYRIFSFFLNRKVLKLFILNHL